MKHAPTCVQNVCRIIGFVAVALAKAALVVTGVFAQDLSEPLRPDSSRQASAAQRFPVFKWVESDAFPAAEAFQAAAADEDHFYAIASTTIGKYSRRTGERIAISHGDAEHLNSGFLDKGELYCAHSNYPNTPERSQIKVLSTQTMRLATLKDFGDSGGSLTWVIRHNGSWYCNFAYYGKENYQTYLVKFDDQWNELQRWNYPSEVIDGLGKYSVSGGIWWRDYLLVTGHDDQVLFCLALPENGTQLRYIGKQACPFEGQGIALDPTTGSLIGIQRSTRQVVFAARHLSLRILSYNIHHGEGVDQRLDLQRIARVIRDADPDLVALQEVDRNVKRSDQMDQVAELAAQLKMYGTFGANIPLQGGEYGNAVLSKYPFVQQQNRFLPTFDNGEQRGVLITEFVLPTMQRRLTLLATHLDHRRGGSERIASAKAVNELAVKFPQSALLLSGDLNDTPESGAIHQLNSQWKRSNRAALATVPVNTPTRQIDYILLHRAAGWIPVDTQVLNESVASDHRPILAIVELPADELSPAP